MSVPNFTSEKKTGYLWAWQIPLPTYRDVGTVFISQCVGSGSGRIQNYLQDPDPQFELQIRIQKGSGILYNIKHLMFI